MVITIEQIDARDAALAHVRALTTPAAANKRFLIGASHFSSTFAVDTLRSLPELAGRLPEDPADEEIRFMKLDVSELDQAFGIKYRTAQETFHDTAKKLLELEKQLVSQ
jgi:nucleoside-diphosphate-sugar epimerase